MEEINLYGKDFSCHTIKPDLQKLIHLSIMGICVSRDFVNMNETDGCVVDRFIQDINPISLGYSSPLGGSGCLDEEDIKKYLVNKELNHFHLRNILLDFNKTAYEYLFDVSSDYLILDTGCLRFHVMIDEKRRRAITQFLMKKLHWDTEDYKEISVMDLQEDIFKSHMDKFVQTMLKYYPQERIILVEVYQADFFIEKNDRSIKKFYGDNSEGNSSIRRGFEYLVKAMPKAHVIPFIRNAIGDERHKWKLGNLHFVPEYYEYGHKALLTILDNHDAEQEQREIDKLRWEYERKIDHNYFFRQLQTNINNKNAKISSTEAVLRKANTQIDSLRNQLLTATDNNRKLEKKIQQLSKKNNNLENSLSFKIGRIVTFFPRKIRDFFKS